MKKKNVCMVGRSHGYFNVFFGLLQDLEVVTTTGVVVAGHVGAQEEVTLKGLAVQTSTSSRRKRNSTR